MPDEPQLSAADLSGNSGTLPTITWNGKDYAVAYPCPAVVELLEKVVVQEVGRRLAALSKVIDEAPDAEMRAEFAAVKKALQDQVSRREQGYCKPLFVETMRDRTRKYDFLWACIALNHPSVTLADVKAMAEYATEQVEIAMGVVDAGFFELAKPILAEQGLAIPPLMAPRKPPKDELPIGSEVTPGSSVSPSI